MHTTNHARLASRSHAKDKDNDNNKNQSRERTTSNHSPLIFYPAYCHKASPTWWKWVKLTAYNIHHNLTSHAQYKCISNPVETENGWRSNESLLLFYLNHPIQFVQVIGIIVSIEDFERFWVLTVDDSSGATIDVKCDKPIPPSKTDRPEALSKTTWERQAKSKTQKDEDKSALYTTIPTLAPGSVAQLKGRITSFRSTRQIYLERITVLATTNQEMELIASRTQFLADVLSKPWVLSEGEQRRLLKEANGEVEEENDRVRRRRKRQKLKAVQEGRHADRIVKEYERQEIERSKAAEQARAAGLLLKNINMAK